MPKKKARRAMFGFGGPRCNKNMWLDTGDVMLGLGGPGCKKKYAAGHGGHVKLEEKGGGVRQMEFWAGRNVAEI